VSFEELATVTVVESSSSSPPPPPCAPDVGVIVGVLPPDPDVAFCDDLEEVGVVNVVALLAGDTKVAYDGVAGLVVVEEEEGSFFVDEEEVAFGARGRPPLRSLPLLTPLPLFPPLLPPLLPGFREEAKVGVRNLRDKVAAGDDEDDDEDEDDGERGGGGGGGGGGEEERVLELLL
jgi:hypothetical protein